MEKSEVPSNWADLVENLRELAMEEQHDLAKLWPKSPRPNPYSSIPGISWSSIDASPDAASSNPGVNGGLDAATSSPGANGSSTDVGPNAPWPNSRELAREEQNDFVKLWHQSPRPIHKPTSAGTNGSSPDMGPNSSPSANGPSLDVGPTASFGSSTDVSPKA